MTECVGPALAYLKAAGSASSSCMTRLGRECCWLGGCCANDAITLDGVRNESGGIQCNRRRLVPAALAWIAREPLMNVLEAYKAFDARQPLPHSTQ